MKLIFTWKIIVYMKLIFTWKIIVYIGICSGDSGTAKNIIYTGNYFLRK
jgi:hypothetical protein